MRYSILILALFTTIASAKGHHSSHAHNSAAAQHEFKVEMKAMNHQFATQEKTLRKADAAEFKADRKEWAAEFKTSGSMPLGQQEAP